MNGKNTLAKAKQVDNDLSNRLRELPIRSKFPRPTILALTSISTPESIDAQADIADRWQEECTHQYGIDSYRSTFDAYEYEGAHRIDPDYVLPWLDEGKILGILGRNDRASECFYMAVKLCDEALEIDPEDANAWWYKAEGLQGLGMLKEAAEAYDRIIEMHHYDLDAQVNKALVLQQLVMDCEALEAFDKATMLGPTHPRPQ